MVHCILRCNSLRVIISQHIVQQIKSFFTHQGFILVVDELVPWLLWVLAEDVIVVPVKCHIVLFNIGKEIICAKDLSYFHKLIVVIFPLEERLFLKNHAGEHAAERPDVK